MKLFTSSKLVDSQNKQEKKWTPTAWWDPLDATAKLPDLFSKHFVCWC
jgi:hypothetical protein